MLEDTILILVSPFPPTARRSLEGRNKMRRTDIFTLTVSYWPSATAAGERPVVAVGFPEGDQYYSPHEFHFQHPPGREDFAEMTGQLPWAQCWLEAGLRDDLARSEWPIVDYMHKAASTSILNDRGQAVGELQVRKYEVWENNGYDRGMAAVHVDNINGVVNRLPKAKRDAAKRALLQHENRVRELYLEKRPETNKARRAIVRQVLKGLEA
jgi:hypothetical protein